MRKYLVEFIGTFFLVLTIVVTVAGGAGSMAPLAIGSILMVMIFAGGHISGAHYNPAVTVGVCLRGACDWKDAPGYIISQLVGGVLAAIIGEYLVGHIGNAAGFPAEGTLTNFDFMAGTVAEFGMCLRIRRCFRWCIQSSCCDRSYCSRNDKYGQYRCILSRSIIGCCSCCVTF